MIPSNAATSSGLTWTKIRRSRTYEFKRGEQIVATFQRPSIWSPTSHADAGDQHWIIRRAGFLSSGAEIVDRITGQVVATYKSVWGGKGSLTFSDGTTFQLDGHGCWHPTWTISHNDQPVLSMRSREKNVEIHNAQAIPESRLLLLTMFTLYRVLQAEEEAAAVAVIAAS